MGWNPGVAVRVTLTEEEEEYCLDEGVARAERRLGSEGKNTIDRGNPQSIVDYVGCAGEFAAYKWLARRRWIFQDWTTDVKNFGNMKINGHWIRVTTTKDQDALLWAKENHKGSVRPHDRSAFMLLVTMLGAGELEMTGYVPTPHFYANAVQVPIKSRPKSTNYSYKSFDLIPAWSFPMALAGVVLFRKVKA